MNWELAFKIANASVIPAWLLLLVVPRANITKNVVHSGLYPLLLGVTYVVLTFVSFGGEGGMDSLANLKLSFQRNEVLLLGWVHYLVFDLFVGAWISRDAGKNDISNFVRVPCLILTLFLGPIGLLLYITFRVIKLRDFKL